MLVINDWSINMLKEKFPNYSISAHCPHGSWQTSRYIQIFVDESDENIHYEYIIDNNWEGRVELHFEEDWQEKYSKLIDELMEKTLGEGDLSWSFCDYIDGYRCQHSKRIEDFEDLVEVLSYMMDLFNKLICESEMDTSSFDRCDNIECEDTLTDLKGPIDVIDMSFDDIIRLPLTIPNYQGTYCWDESNVKRLLDDVFEYVDDLYATPPYHVGTIILHSHDNRYDIIDGQQRLVTLALLLSELGVKTGLLEAKFSSKRSIDYIKYNKYLIHNYVKSRHISSSAARTIGYMLSFSVLVLQNTSIDLAYTFFSNHNSRGVQLTDYDLLKAHHLRYMPSSNEQQAEHVANVWNKMIEDGRNDNDQTTMPDYARALDTYIYRLRRWMRKKDCDDSIGNYRVKREYEVAPMVDEIPSYGGHFNFNESIQGGAYFFSYVEQHLNKYRQFVATEEYSILHNTIYGGTNQWYRDVIESVLFCYFLKFGTFYLSDALVVIMRILLQHRYVSLRANKASIVRYVGDSELVLMIDRATSPTFFLAEARNIAKELYTPSRPDMSPIMRLMRNRAYNITKMLEKKIVVESFKNLNI